MNYEKLSRELARAVRGNRSQAAFNYRFGYSTNVAHSWESGRRQPTATRFFEIAEDLGVDVCRGLQEFLQENADQVTPTLSCSKLVQALLADMRGSLKIAAIARRLDKPRMTVARWFGGAVTPKLAQLLQLVDALSPRLPEFCAIFISPSELPSMATTWKNLKDQERLAAESPWSHAVLRALELREYREAPTHCAQTLAEATGLPPAEVEELLRLLIDSNQATLAPSGHWQPAEVLTVDTGGYAPSIELQKRHWARVALKRFESDRLGDGLFSYNLCSVSESDYQRIRRVYLDSYHAIRTIVASSEGCERVLLFQQSLTPLDA